MSVSPRYLYVDSDIVANTAVPLRAASTAYSVGDVVRASNASQTWQFLVCRTAGTTSTATTISPTQTAGVWNTFSDGTVQWQQCHGTDEFGWLTALNSMGAMSLTGGQFVGMKTNSLWGSFRTIFLLKNTGSYALSFNPYNAFTSVGESGVVMPSYARTVSFVSVAPDGATGFVNTPGALVQLTTGTVMGGSLYFNGCIMEVQNGAAVFAAANPLAQEVTRKLESVWAQSCTIRLTTPVDTDLGSTLTFGYPVLSDRGANLAHFRFEDVEFDFSHRLDTVIFRGPVTMRNVRMALGSVDPVTPFRFSDAMHSGRGGGWRTTNVFNQGNAVYSPMDRIPARLVGCDFSSVTDSTSLFESNDGVPVTMEAEGCIWPTNVPVLNTAPEWGLNCVTLTERDCRLASQSTLAGRFKYRTNGLRLSKVDGVYRVGGAVDRYAVAHAWHLTTNIYLEPFYDFALAPPIERELPATGHYRAVIHLISPTEGLTQDDLWAVLVSPQGATSQPQDDVNNKLAGYYTTRKQGQDLEPAALATDDVTWSGVSTGFKYKLEVPFYAALGGKIHVQLFVARPKTEVFLCPKVELHDLLAA